MIEAGPTLGPRFFQKLTNFTGIEAKIILELEDKT